jgi:hypothetical protein
MKEIVNVKLTFSLPRNLNVELILATDKSGGLFET